MSPSGKRRTASGKRGMVRLTVDVLRGTLEPGGVDHFTQGMKDEYERVSSTPLPGRQKGEEG